MASIGGTHQDGLMKGFSSAAIENHDAGLANRVAGYDQATAIDQIDIRYGGIADHHG
jgi:SLT domain-containing protein